jgi:hypothetical protein
MIRRRDSLSVTLHEIETGDLEGVAVIVVSRGWWDELMVGEQTLFRRRCENRGIALRTDERLTRHYVELGSAREGPLLSSERQL